VLRELSSDKDEVLWKDCRKVLKDLKELFSGNVCVFKDTDAARTDKLNGSWVPCIGRKASTKTTKVEGFSSWVDDFPSQWEYGVLYVANPLKDQYDRPDQKVPCFVLHEFDQIHESWQMDMFCCALSLSGAKTATMTISSEDGVETSKMVVDKQKDETKSRQGRFSLSRLADRRGNADFVLDHTALEDYIRLFGSQMIDSLGRNRLTELAESIKSTGRLGEPGEGGDAGPPHLSGR